MSKFDELKKAAEAAMQSVSDFEYEQFQGTYGPAKFLELLAIQAQLMEALKQALETIDDYLAYEHNGDPWTEDARTMGEMDINDYANDGRQAKAIGALALAGDQP